MLTIGIIDDNVGFFSTYYKLKQVVCANFVCMVLENSFPLNRLSTSKVYAAGLQAINSLSAMGCDVIVLSSNTLSALYKRFVVASPAQLYACEAPVLHAATYTASNVLVCGDAQVLPKQMLPNALYCKMEQFPILAQSATERQIVEYIEQCLIGYEGKFDCIALACSSMNMFKHCFNRVCPNVRIFDSLDGVARKIRKKYKKFVKDEGVCQVLNQQGEDISEKYRIFLE